MNGVERIAAERQRQVDVEGWTPEHDGEHDDGSLTSAARCYAHTALCQMNSDMPTNTPPGDGWPWTRTVVAYDFTRESVRDGWKPSTDPIRNLEKAGALIAAEIDRLQAARTPVVADWKLCGPCSLGVHDDCRRHDSAPCQCDGSDSCGAALRVFTAAPIDGSTDA